MISRKLLTNAVLFLFAIATAAPLLGQRMVPLKIQYQFPLNGSTAISRTTTIIISQGDYINSKTVNSNLITVKGTFSGTHSGKFDLSDDKKTLVFTPTLAFT